jgi:subtilisin family serine protease
VLTGRRAPAARRWRARTAAVAAATLAAGWAGLLAATPAHADVARSAELWVLTDLALPTAWQHTQGSGVTVAVIDSGVDPDVSDLTGSVITGPDFSGVDTSPSNSGWGVHGTWMASLIAGHGHGSGDGILGAAPQSKVLSIRVITDSADPNYPEYEAESATKGQSELAEAITYAVTHHAGVISMSLGYNLQSLAVRQALQDAYDHNVVVVASAGNSGDSAGASGAGQAPYSFPADYPGVLGVGAVDEDGQPASFSSENLSVQVAAPGDRVPAQGRDGQYWYVSGTSPACALTAGVAALIKSAYPKLTDTQVISAITSSTTPSSRPPGGWDQQIGFGEVNAASALAAAGTIAATGQPAAGLAATSHFGGGPAAVPAAPVAPRGPAALVGYGLLALACLVLVALASSRLFTAGGPAYQGYYPVPGGLSPPAGPSAGQAAAAWQDGPELDLWRPRPGDDATRPLRPPGEGWRRSAAGPAGYPGGAGPWAEPDPSPWPTGAPAQEPRHAAPPGHDTGQPEGP